MAESTLNKSTSNPPLSPQIHGDLAINFDQQQSETDRPFLNPGDMGYNLPLGPSHERDTLLMGPEQRQAPLSTQDSFVANPRTKVTTTMNLGDPFSQHRYQY